MFEIGKEYRRQDLHLKYGGQEQGGISTPSIHPFIMLFTGETGEQYGYQDGWQSDQLYFYSGEGREGDMQFVRGNRAIRDHEQNGKALYLFKYVRRGFVEYRGEFLFTGYHTRQVADQNGNTRSAIIFELRPVE